MPYKDPEKRRAYHRAYQRAYSKTHKRKRRPRRKRKPPKTGLERWDRCIDTGRCIWHCLTSKPCRRKAVERSVYCEVHKR